MLVTPLPGVPATHAISALREVHTDAVNARGAHSGSGAAGPTDRYLKWAHEALYRLRGVLRPGDLDRLVLTRSYWALQAYGPVASEMVAPIRVFVDLELDGRIAEIEAVLQDLERRHERWNNVGRLMVADTSFYIEAELKLEVFDFAALLGARGDRLHLLVPILVLDELDGRKGRRDARDDIRRWRPGYTLAVISRHLRGPDQIARLREEDFSALGDGGIPRGEITVEVVLDPPRHSRMPIPDDELIDRAVAIGHVAGRPVAFLTKDTSQAFRARAAGLDVFELPKAEPGDEPGLRASNARRGG